MRSIAVLLVLIATSLSAQTTATRTYSGGFSSRWLTEGKHGHDQPLCGQPECDWLDLARGNLDNSIGFRAGWERDFLSLRNLKIVGGAEGSVGYTEYNLSQADFAMFDGSITAGVDLDVRSAQLGVRYGGGPFASTNKQYGLQYFQELFVQIPLRSGAAVRIALRETNHRLFYINRIQGFSDMRDRGVQARETSILITGSGSGEDSKWEFATSSGASEPGNGPGSSLNLRATTYHRMTVLRTLRWPRIQAYLEWTASAHESRLPGEYKGFPFNFRSKTIDSFGIGMRRERRLNGALSLHYGGGIEAADWRDDYDLLVRNSGTRVIGGIEAALAANAQIRCALGRGTALDVHFEQVYWTGIRLAETRWGIGFAFTR